MQANCFIDSLFSDINNSISAPALGAGGRGFESRYPDEENQVKIHKIKPVQLVLAFLLYIE